jgi:pimeloyl-ACP methyl ester carboxylesterase
MIEDAAGPVDYDESGQGPTIVLVPGSCSTGAAWKAVIARLGGQYRTIATSLPGYGGSAERRTDGDRSIAPVASAVEAVIRRTGGPVHLVGHSFGGEVGLAVALRGRVELQSLAIFEAPAPGMLSVFGRSGRYEAFRAMTDAYIADFRAGNAEAIAAMVDFYGGPGTFESWPAPVRSYAAKTIPTNILDWESAYCFEPSPSALAALNLPLLVAVGENSHPAVVEANGLIAGAVPGASFATIPGAAHFMTATHAQAVADLIVRHLSSPLGQAGNRIG